MCSLVTRGYLRPHNTTPHHTMELKYIASRMAMHSYFMRRGNIAAFAFVTWLAGLYLRLENKE